jgi:hypothetical protein
MLPEPVFLFKILVAAAVLLLPGLAYVACFAPRDRDPLEVLADAGGLSLALLALSGEFAFFFDFPLLQQDLRWLVVAYTLAAFAGLLFRKQFTWKGLGVFLSGLILLAGLSAWRLYQARDLLFPAWVDSVHHTLIVEKILEAGGLPDNLEPYLPVPFYYHYGFHLAAALFSKISGASPAESLLWFGQVISALATLAVYRLAKQAFGDWKRALLAALLVGFVFHMPAYYLSWGRYPLLTGLAVLSPAAASAVEVVQHPQRRGAFWQLVLLTGGLALVHYLALVVLGLVFFSFIAVRLAPILWAPLRDLRGRLQHAWQLPLAGVLGIALASLWLLRLYHFLPFIASFGISELPQITQGLLADDQVQYILTLLGPQPSHFLLALAGLGLLIAAFQPARLSSARWLVVWALVMALLSLPWGVKISGFRPDHFAILMFLPASLLSSHLLVSGAEATSKRLARSVGAGLLLLASAGLLVFGGRTTVDIINPVTVFVDRADLQALNWINDNVPMGARFYHFPVYWQADIYRGADGAAWLLPYTKRFSMVPPAVYKWASPAYWQPINDWAQRAQTLQGCSPDFWALVSDADLTHLYLREGVGSLQASQLGECARLQVLYDHAGVAVYEILRP